MPLPLVLTEVTVTGVQRLSPSFVRVELAADALADFGVDGAFFDQRIKLVFPADDGRLPSFAGADESWFDTWLEIPEAERGHMRTYTVREVRGTGRDTRVVVNVVVHVEDSASGPGSRWASSAAVGDRIVLLGPRRAEEFGGIEFVPGAARRLLLAGDETALPAVASILADLPDTAVGTAFVEVPVSDDVMDVTGPAGVRVVWLPRDGAERGHGLVTAVLAHLGADAEGATVEDDDVDPDVWETPTYSSSGEQIDDLAPAGRPHDDLYCWIAGESAVVTTLRRHLVKDLGIDRRQVAFMGYWREGVAMRS